eukprot:scaffold31886_cov66-Attheya_sp.AAC.10
MFKRVQLGGTHGGISQGFGNVSCSFGCGSRQMVGTRPTPFGGMRVQQWGCSSQYHDHFWGGHRQNVTPLPSQLLCANSHP